MNPLDELPYRAYSVAEVCKLYNLSRSTFYNMQILGVGPAIVRIGGQMRVLASALRVWEAKLAAGELEGYSMTRLKAIRDRLKKRGKPTTGLGPRKGGPGVVREWVTKCLDCGRVGRDCVCALPDATGRCRRCEQPIEQCICGREGA